MVDDAQDDESEVSEFMDNFGEVDFAVFEGFEPFPFGYRFDNSSPDYSILTGGVEKSDSIW